MKKAQKTKSPSWSALNMRLTLFFSEPRHVEPAPLWHDLFGSHAKGETRNRAENALLENADHMLKDGSPAEFHLSSTPQRQDLLLAPVPKASDVTGLLCLGNFEETLTEFIGVAQKLIDQQKAPISRVAFGTMLAQVVPTRVAGYSLLDDLLPQVQVPTSEDVSDFTFVINRPRKSKMIDGLKINRLSSWRCMNQQMSLFGPNQTTITSETIFALVDLDMNTHPANTTVFKTSEIKSLFSELTGLAAEIASHGDIA